MHMLYIQIGISSVHTFPVPWNNLRYCWWVDKLRSPNFWGCITFSIELFSTQSELEKKRLLSCSTLQIQYHFVIFAVFLLYRLHSPTPRFTLYHHDECGLETFEGSESSCKNFISCLKLSSILRLLMHYWKVWKLPTEVLYGHGVLRRTAAEMDPGDSGALHISSL